MSACARDCCHATIKVRLFRWACAEGRAQPDQRRKPNENSLEAPLGVTGRLVIVTGRIPKRTFVSKGSAQCPATSLFVMRASEVSGISSIDVSRARRGAFFA